MLAVKRKYGIDDHLQSCHTAIDVASGLVFEGHVPAGAIKQFLANPPQDALGLSVPGMATGSPGMEMGGRFDPYQIMQINASLPPSIYMKVDTQAEQSAIGSGHD